MSFPVGIGIITYNRKDIVAATIDRVRALTREPDAAVVVADDGSTDGTLEMLRAMQVPVVTGANMGIAWNKNRALFLLAEKLACETVILLEDDTRPGRLGWEEQWMLAARRWGHVNYAAGWLRKDFIGGSGTAEDPVRSRTVTAQCAGYARAALAYAGYFDPRFTGYGHEHVEHTLRMIRLGSGGRRERIDGDEQVMYYLITGDMVVVPTSSHSDDAQIERNLHLAHRLIAEEGYRAPWRDDGQLRQFRSEIESSFGNGPASFALHKRPGTAPAPPPPRDRLTRLLPR
jgi:glycosyltransferase involved in cell wall biosynthesis